MTGQLFAGVRHHLADRGITLCPGTPVDGEGANAMRSREPPNSIDAPSSTRNEAKARDPGMSSTKKGNDRFFGSEEDQETLWGSVSLTNAHVGVDARSGIVHGLDTTTARTHDSQVRDDLLHGAETSVWADKGYISAGREAAFSGPDKFRGVRRRRAADFIPSTSTSTGSLPRSGRGSGIPSEGSGASSVI